MTLEKLRPYLRMKAIKDHLGEDYEPMTEFAKDVIAPRREALEFIERVIEEAPRRPDLLLSDEEIEGISREAENMDALLASDEFRDSFGSFLKDLLTLDRASAGEYRLGRTVFWMQCVSAGVNPIFALDYALFDFLDTDGRKVLESGTLEDFSVADSARLLQFSRLMSGISSLLADRTEFFSEMPLRALFVNAVRRALCTSLEVARELTGVYLSFLGSDTEKGDM
ncbi:MAG: hypothetical protein AB1324_05090 [Candidatus Micrarchaeota archaeon]